MPHRVYLAGAVPLTAAVASAALAAGSLSGCVPSGTAQPDAGASTKVPSLHPPTSQLAQAAFVASADIMKAPYEEDFDHVPGASTTVDAAPDAPNLAESAVVPDWATSSPASWHVERGQLCGEHAQNHGIWLERVLPINARIEFDAVSYSPDGDLKAEFWGDGHSHATMRSYTNATSYLTIFGGWHNQFHVLARLDEHGLDRKEIRIDPGSDDPREKPVAQGQRYHFKVERADGRTIRWWVDGNEMLVWNDAAPLAGQGHDHFGFNDWEVKVCFDNVKVTPLP